MNEVRTILNDEKSYHVGDIIKNFPIYFGISFEEVRTLFFYYKKIDKEEIKEYIYNNQEFMWENRYNEKENVEKIIEERILDYILLEQKIAILAHKGINYLNMLDYVASIPDILHEDDFYELVFERLQISHYGKGMIGSHLKKILIPLNNIVKELKELLKEINTLENYNRQRLDSFARSYGEYKYYAIDNVVFNDASIIVDKTSINCSKIKYRKM